MGRVRFSPDSINTKKKIIEIEKRLEAIEKLLENIEKVTEKLKFDEQGRLQACTW